MFETWREAGLEPEEAIGAIRKEREVVSQSVTAAGGQAGPIRGFVIPTMQALGLFSERIEGHFRNLFAVTMGEDRARALEFGWQLPEDLEDWVMS